MQLGIMILGWLVMLMGVFSGHYWLMFLGMLVSPVVLGYAGVQRIRHKLNPERELPLRREFHESAHAPVEATASEVKAWPVKSESGVCPDCGGHLSKRGLDMRAGYYVQRWYCSRCHKSVTHPLQVGTPALGKRGIKVTDADLQQWLRSNKDLRIEGVRR